MKQRFHFLDGLRGIAALMIVVHHCFTANIVSALEKLGLKPLAFFISNFTQSGVEMFFVLSGVVLLRPYLRTGRKLKVRDFYFRRFKRIYPTYWGALLFGAGVIWLMMSFPTWYSKSMLFEFSAKEIFDEAAIFNFDNHYYNLAWWSLQIEVLFYALAPVIVLLLARTRFKPRTAWLWTGALLTGATLLQVYLTSVGSSIYSYNEVILTLFKFIDYPVCFALGVYIAGYDSDKKQATTFIAAGCALVLASYFYVPFVHSGYGLCYAGLIIFLFHEGRLKRLFERPLFIWLGERSYSLFLTHFSVLYLLNFTISNITPDRNLVYGVLTRGLAFPACLFVAMLLFHFVERRYAKGLQTANAFWPWQVLRAETAEETEDLPQPSYGASTEPASSPSFFSEISRVKP